MDDNNEEVKKETIEVVREEPEVKRETNEPEKDRKGFAIASMVLGIIALVLFCIVYISIPCAILALIFGILSVKSSKRGMAIAGITTGAIGFILTVLLYVFVFVVVGVGTYTGLDSLQDALEEYEHNNYDYHYNLYDDSKWH